MEDFKRQPCHFEVPRFAQDLLDPITRNAHSIQEYVLNSCSSARVRISLSHAACNSGQQKPGRPKPLIAVAPEYVLNSCSSARVRISLSHAACNSGQQKPGRPKPLIAVAPHMSMLNIGCPGFYIPANNVWDSGLHLLKSTVLPPLSRLTTSNE